MCTPELPELAGLLTRYFPAGMREKHSRVYPALQDAASHSPRREILSSNGL